MVALGSSRRRGSRAATPRSIPTSRATKRGCASSSASSRSRAGSRATSRPRHPARSMRAASSATRSCTPMAPRSTTRTSSSAASSATARPRRGPLAASWHSTKFVNPARDGAVLPVLHLNGYKIANPTVLARIPEDELRALLEGYGHAPRFVTGDDPEAVHQALAAELDAALDEIAEIQRRASDDGDRERPRWPMIVLRTPKGWTGPKEVDGKPAEGTWRSHQVPLAGLADNPEHLRQLEEWMRSYRPEELFDEEGRPRDG